jgi:FkbM family methyltransferase
MRNFAKKLIHSVEGIAPSIVDAKYSLFDAYYEATGKVSKQDLNGLRLFDTCDTLMVDIGCNRGQCIRAFKNIDPTIRIVAFEPLPFLSEKVVKKYRDDPAVTVLSYALSDMQGEISINVPSYNGVLFDGMAAVEPRAIREAMNLDRFFWYDEAKLSMARYDVPVRTLDSFNLAPDFIKLHAQRHEIEILRGAMETIKAFSPVIIAAWAWKEEIGFLRELGYTQYAWRDGRLAPGNANEEFTFFLQHHHLESVSCCT